MQHIKVLCPKCKTQYFVSIMQLTVATGKVCCCKCTAEFNAYEHLSSSNIHLKHKPIEKSFQEHQVCVQTSKIFEAKANNSNIDLQTYLNSSQNIQPEVLVDARPSLSRTAQNPKKTPAWLTAILFVTNTLFILICLSQFIVYSTNNYPQYNFLGKIFKQKCHERYCAYQQAVEVKVLHIESHAPHMTTITGVVINHSDHAQQLPIIKLIMNKTKIRNKHYQFLSSEYLPYFFKHHTQIKPKQTLDFRVDLLEVDKNVHSIQVQGIRPD